MDKHWSHFCAMSVVHFMAFPDTAGGGGPILESVRRIAEDDFFDGIEVAWINDPETRREVKHILAAGGMRVGFGAHPAILSRQLNLNSLDQAERLKAVEAMKPLIDQAVELEAERFIFLTGRDPGEQARAAAFEALLDSIRRMCAYGQERGISLGLETFDRRIDKKALIGPSAEAARLSAAIRADYPDFGLLYDQGHMPLLDETPADMALIREHLVHVHLGNCVKVEGRPLYGDNHPYFGFAGGENGVEELAHFIRALFEVGYLAEGQSPRPWVGFEIKTQGPGETPDLILANARRTWRQAWAEV